MSTKKKGKIDLEDDRKSREGGLTGSEEEGEVCSSEEVFRNSKVKI